MLLVAVGLGEHFLSVSLVTHFTMHWSAPSLHASPLSPSHLSPPTTRQPDAFFFNALPFAEDIREFYFPSLESLPANQQPTPVQLRAAEELVRSLTVAGAQAGVREGEQESGDVSGAAIREAAKKGEPQREPLAPEATPNTVLQVRLSTIKAP